MDDILFGFVEFLRRRRSNLVCQADERRRFSLSGVDVNRFCFGEDEIVSFSSLPFTSSSAKSQNFGVSTLYRRGKKEREMSAKKQKISFKSFELYKRLFHWTHYLLPSFSFWQFCSFESRFSTATAFSYEASLF